MGEPTTANTVTPLPDLRWTDDDVDAAGRAMDMLALADLHLGCLAGASDELAQTKARQEVVNHLAGAHEELGTLLGRLCGTTPVGELERLRAENAARRDLLAMATEFTVGDRDNELDPFSFVSVQWRRDDLWVARVGDMKTRALTADLECEWEASPSNRTDDFRDSCYCPLPDAMDRTQRWLARRAEKAVSHG